MIVKTKKGFYVYSAPNRIGRRVRLSNALPTYAQAKLVNKKCKSCRGRKRKKS